MGRDPKHDYWSRCIYYITIGKDPACPVFSQVVGSPEQPVVIPMSSLPYGRSTFLYLNSVADSTSITR